MGKPAPPAPVKLFTGILCNRTEPPPEIQIRLERALGPVDYKSPRFPFDLTDYYDREMGTGIGRWFWSFEKPIDPGQLPEIKLLTNKIEALFAEGNRRTVNLDPGYLDFHKVILASVKDRAQKIYLDKGVYADPTLFYIKGGFHSYEWSLPDFKTPVYYPVFHRIRELYRLAMKETA
ncbi:DUF4416 family protein [bacterium]|nr:DUF4416 family protein [candidate division CSSED10-310 bacterium]